MTHKSNFYLNFLAVISLLAVSCGKDGEKDTSCPVIILIEPEDGEEYKIGDEADVHLEFDVVYESGLGQYKIDIHDATGHTHSATKAYDATVAWNYQKIYDDVRNLRNHHVHVHSEAIPQNAKLGGYHLMIYATDVLGNESFVYTTIKLVDYDVEHNHDTD